MASNDQNQLPSMKPTSDGDQSKKEEQSVLPFVIAEALIGSLFAPLRGQLSALLRAVPLALPPLIRKRSSDVEPKLFIVSLLMGVIVAAPYIFLALRHPATSPQFFVTASIIGWTTGIITTLWTGGRALYFGWQNASQLGVLANDFAVIFLGYLAVVWGGVFGISKSYKPILSRTHADEVESA